MEYIVIKRISRRAALTVLLLFSALANCSLFPIHYSLLHAQDDARQRQVYAQAERDYQIGRTEQARDSLMLHLNTFQGNLRENALRLIALTYLESFDVKQTERYATLMLQQNPYYTVSSQAPTEFADIVSRIKAAMTPTVSTASNQEESLAEVPVPTTLITEEMIRNSGARNLQEVLAAYVPGMHLIDCNDDVNIAMRGVYSTTQEKLLIMLNGHRMNSYVTNTAAPDFSMSLEKIRQIEVLRGPASSLYGGVALTGVVNIITKTGGDIDGFVVKAGIGNYGQKRADLLVGKRYYDIDVMAWASVYHNKGEQRHVGSEHKSSYPSFKDTNDSIFIGRVGSHPAFDLGVVLSLKGFQALYNTRFSQTVAPFTFSTSAFAYDYDAYPPQNGRSPGFSHFTHHAELSYKYMTGPFSMRLSGTYDREEATRYQVLSESPNPYLATVMGLDYQRDFFYFNGLSRLINLHDHNFGLQLKSGYDYTLGSDHKGSLTFGAEYSHFMLDDIKLLYSYDYDYDNDFMKKFMLDFTSENSANVSLQLKNQWRSLILNAGMRYDHKHRYDDTEANVLSPRIALILLRPKWNAKFSFSQAFVDAPYLYRAMNALNYMNEESSKPKTITLSPEYLKSFQLSFAGNGWIKGLDFEINGFANYTSDIIRSDGIKYRNAGRNNTIGVELMANYKTPRFTANLNLTWLKTFKSEIAQPDMTGDEEEGEENYMEDTPAIVNGNINTPGIMSNLVLTWQATSRLKLHTHVLFEGKQTSHYLNINAACEYEQCYQTILDWGLDSEEGKQAEARLIELFDEYYAEKDMSARAIVNLGADYTLGKFCFSLNVNNLFNTRYNRSGMDAPLMPQQGRWFMASIGVKL